METVKWETAKWETSIANKRRAVAVQIARSRCKVLSIQNVYYLGLTNYERQWKLERKTEKSGN